MCVRLPARSSSVFIDLEPQCSDIDIRGRLWLAVIHFSISSRLVQVAQCYPAEMGAFPQQLIDLLEQHANALEQSLRLCIAKVRLSRSPGL